MTAAGDGVSAAVASCRFVLRRFVLRFFVDFLLAFPALVDFRAAFFVVFLAIFFVDFFAAFLVDLFAADFLEPRF